MSVGAYAYRDKTPIIHECTVGATLLATGVGIEECDPYLHVYGDIAGMFVCLRRLYFASMSLVKCREQISRSESDGASVA
jgi:hypothetical protein